MRKLDSWPVLHVVSAVIRTHIVCQPRGPTNQQQRLRVRHLIYLEPTRNSLYLKRINTFMLLAFTATRRLDESIWSGFSKHFPSVRPPRQTMCHVTSSTKTFQLTIKQSAGSLVDWFNYVKLWRNVSLEWNKVQTASPVVTMVISRFCFSNLFILYGITDHGNGIMGH